MTFKFAEHDKCRASWIEPQLLNLDTCNADRALVAKEGERLQREVQLWEVRCSAHKALGLTDMTDLQAENARLESLCVQRLDRITALEKELMVRRENESRLRGALEYARGWIPDEEFERKTPLSDAALEGK